MGKGKKDKIQWHPAFVAAMKLELREYSKHLIYETEHVLNKASIKADFLLMKKKEISMEAHEWGGFFEQHNLFEYKGIGDALDWRVFSKGLAYTYLYASKNKKGEGREWKNITLTFLRREKPGKLFKELEKQDFQVEKKGKGVYYIGNKIVFKVQIIVLREIKFEEHPWLAALAKDLDAEDIRELFRQEGKLVNREDKDNAVAVMEVVARANQSVLNELRGDDDDMGKALMELVKPEIDALLAEKDAEMAERVAEKDKQLQSSQNKLKEEESENSRLRKEIEELKKQISSMNKIAML